MEEMREKDFKKAPEVNKVNKRTMESLSDKEKKVLVNRRAERSAEFLKELKEKLKKIKIQ